MTLEDFFLWCCKQNGGVQITIESNRKSRTTGLEILVGVETESQDGLFIPRKMYQSGAVILNKEIDFSKGAIFQKVLQDRMFIIERKMEA